MMKRLAKIGLLGILLTFSTLLSGQSEDKSILVTVETLERDYNKTEHPNKKSLPSMRNSNKDFYRHHKKLPKTFEGYAIELTTSDFPLNRDYHLFEQFGTIYYERVKDQGYAYVIIADFSSKKAIKEYIEKVVVHRAPEARVLEYKNGERVDK